MDTKKTLRQGLSFSVSQLHFYCTRTALVSNKFGVQTVLLGPLAPPSTHLGLRGSFLPPDFWRKHGPSESVLLKSKSRERGDLVRTVRLKKSGDGSQEGRPWLPKNGCGGRWTHWFVWAPASLACDAFAKVTGWHIVFSAGWVYTSAIASGDAHILSKQVQKTCQFWLLPIWLLTVSAPSE